MVGGGAGQPRNNQSCFSKSSVISSMHRDTEELLKGMELVISLTFCFITDEIIREKKSW